LTHARVGRYGQRMLTPATIDLMLSTLNATDVGTLDSIASKLREVQKELENADQAELATRAAEVIAALGRGDIAEFKRGRAFLQSKIGHLRP
jgi:hypothetical protein